MDQNNKDDLLRINLNRLEVDAAEHARLLRQWGDKAAEAECKVRTGKNALRLIKAETAVVVRANPGNYGIRKISVEAVEDVVVQTRRYRDAETILVAAEYDRDILKSMVSALHERGEQIGNEVKLHGQQYWAKPRADQEDIQGVKEENAVDTMAAVMKTKKKKSK